MKNKVILIGLFLLILNVGFTYFIFEKQNQDYSKLNQKLNNLSNGIDNLTKDTDSLGININSINNDFVSLGDSRDFSEIIKNSLESVVIIKSRICLEGNNCARKQVGVIGTGFFVYEGYLITNLHVISSADTSSIEIETYDGENYSISNNTLSKIGENSERDISLLKIENSNYLPLNLDDSDNIKIGEKVIAIGNPLGLEFSVTSGIISATNKKIKSHPGEYIQTDTPLNPGSSGGPLINQKGKVIGINNYKIFLTEGLGFALESNDIKQSINEISLSKLGYRLV